MYFYQIVIYIHICLIQRKFIYSVYIRTNEVVENIKKGNKYATTSFLVAIMQIFHEYNIENYSLMYVLRINKDKEKLFDYFLGKL